MLPLVGPEDPSTIAVPAFTLVPPPAAPAAVPPPPGRLTVNSSPTLFLTTIAANIYLRSHEVADPSLKAALGMFRRAANFIARVEDCLIFNGRPAPAPPPALTFPANVPPNIQQVTSVTSDTLVPLEGLLGGAAAPRAAVALAGLSGVNVVDGIITAIGELDDKGYQGPYAVALSQTLFDAICNPNPGNLILPRDRILPFLQGPLLRASAIPNNEGVVVSLSGVALELLVAADLSLRFLQTTTEPRYVFRLSERVAVRVREADAIRVLQPPPQQQQAARVPRRDQ
jgi:uncharacterized linocin/CFP29 family protein